MAAYTFRCKREREEEPSPEIRKAKIMTSKNLDGFFFSLATDEELDEMMKMTKAELAKIYVELQVASGVINPPASYEDQEQYISRRFRKAALIDGILMLRGMVADSESDEDEDEEETLVSFRDLPVDEQNEIAMRIAALAIMDGIDTYDDMRDEADCIRDQFWMRYRSIDENPAMWNCYQACVHAASFVEQYWLASHHEALGYAYDDRMEYFYTSIRAIIDDIEIAREQRAEDDGTHFVHFNFWPESTTPIAMTLDESDSLRATGDYDADPVTTGTAFADSWKHGCPEVDLPYISDEGITGIEETIDMYADEYDDLRYECGDEAWTPDEVAEYLYEQVEKESEKLLSPQHREWSDEDERALSEFASLLADDVWDDESDDIVEEWHEWIVLAGELERIDSGSDRAAAVWAWCPDHRAELPGSDSPMRSLEEARRVFDAYDPLGLWFAKRHAEVQAGEDPQIWRRYEVDLVCQTCSRDADGLISVRDDAVRLSKDFDVDGDTAAQALISSILAHI